MRLSEREKHRWIASCSSELIKCFSECSMNILCGNVPLNNRQFLNLRRQKHDIRQLAMKDISQSQKRRILQKAGLVDVLLAPVLALFCGKQNDSRLEPSSTSSRRSDSSSSTDTSDGDDEESGSSCAPSEMGIDGEEQEDDESKPVGGGELCACPYCGATYVSVKSWRRHMRAKHHREPDGRPSSPSTVRRAKASSQHRRPKNLLD